MRNLRTCIGLNSLLRVDSRLEKADLHIDITYLIILPSRQALTPLINYILYEHAFCGHAGPSYTFVKTRPQFRIILGISSVKYYISECGNSALYKAKPIRQLMAELPGGCLTACNKSFKFCGSITAVLIAWAVSIACTLKLERVNKLSAATVAVLSKNFVAVFQQLAICPSRPFYNRSSFEFYFYCVLSYSPLLFEYIRFVFIDYIVHIPQNIVYLRRRI